MSHQPAEPTIDDPENSTASVTSLSKQQARMRLWQAKAAQAEISDGGVGRPKRRQPSMPILPWDNSK